VLGLVLPIKQGDDIIGILKVNLNILGAISHLVLRSQQEHVGEFKLVRSGGEIIFEDGSEPLKNRVPDVFSEKLHRGEHQPFVFEDSENTWLIGMSEIGITSGMNGVGFGGTFESIDHKKGNAGESWYILNYRELTDVLQPLTNLTLITFSVGVLLTIFLAFAALLLGNQAVKPLMQLIEHSTNIAKGEFGSRMSISRNDEIGYLGNAFNTMAEELEKTTTSIVNLESEISERKRAEEELQHAQKAAETANRAKSAFLANMSHELRTPLNGILGYTQILRRDDDLSDRQRKQVDIIHQSGEHLLTMINDILDLSKIEAHKMDLEPVDFPLPGLLHSVVAICRIRAYKKGITFEYDTPSGIPAGVFGDEKRLRQVLLNLLSNAIKFTDQGSVVLRVEAVEPEHRLPADSVHRLRFRIEDTGQGIPADQLGTIFSPFQQVRVSSEKRSQYTASNEGTGLGLAISRQFVQMMGGELRVTSTVGQGSVFWFEIELPDAALPEQTGGKSYGRIVGFRGEPRTLLIADDKPVNRAVLRDLLQPLGFSIVEAVNGRDMLDKAQASHPDLMLLDLIMPEMDGYEAVRHVRQNPALQQIPVIAISASAFEQTRRESRDAGCDDFLAKPFRDDDLLELLARHVELEWIVEEAGVSQYPVPFAEEQPLVFPPDDELAPLHELALHGDVMELQEQAVSLKNRNTAWAPFAEHILHLAETFQISTIQDLLEAHLSGEPATCEHER